MSFVGPRPERPFFVERLNQIFLITICVTPSNRGSRGGRKSVTVTAIANRTRSRSCNTIYTTSSICRRYSISRSFLRVSKLFFSVRAPVEVDVMNALTIDVENYFRVKAFANVIYRMIGAGFRCELKAIPGIYWSSWIGALFARHFSCWAGWVNSYESGAAYPRWRP